MESMKDFEKELEVSYQYMGDGEKDTDQLLAWETVKGYLESKENLEVEITSVVNKGVIAMLEGLRAFIPGSRLSLRRVEDLNEWVGKKIRVRVITADPENNKLVLSAREILKEERDAQKAERAAAIEVGAVLTGTVETIKEYGAFVGLGEGVSGLVHISQISRERIKHPSVVLSEGQEVKVKVIGKKDGKISLSMKALEEAKEEEEEIRVEIPKAEEIGTSLGDLLKNIKL